MPCGKKKYCATCHNFKSSLTIILNDGNQYFEKKIIFMSKNIHSVMYQILINGWSSMTSSWHHGCNYNGVAMSCIIYTMTYNFATHATCPLALMTYKYNELQVFSTTQKLNYKASCKIPIFFIVFEDVKP